MNNDWISIADRPLRFYDNGQWWLTDDGDKEFLAAVPYIDKGKDLWWIRHCVIENGRLCIVGDDDNEISGWEIPDVTHWMLERYEDSHIGFYVDGKTFGDEGFSWSESIEIPFGSWQIICTTKEMTEQKIAELYLVDWFEIVGGERGYKDYCGDDEYRYPFKTRKESFSSLLRSVNLNPEGNYLILKKQ